MSNEAKVDNRAGIPLNKPNIGKVAILTADQVEDIEFFYPYYRFMEEGYEVDVITPTGGVLKASVGWNYRLQKNLMNAIQRITHFFIFLEDWHLVHSDKFQKLFI
ncbi:DJ-1/PfpI family protein [Neobacillus sp. MM2021_6]|nr:DJ-1/PfpI family protein [Neobacillus sp. MM2021_6]NHC21454.1 hypothetical protein [Bacillus sp. MM2020_4]